MKKVFILMFAISLTLIAASGVMAASRSFGMVGYSDKDFENPYMMINSRELAFLVTPKFEGWYTVETSAPYAAARGTFEGTKVYDFEIYQNDQTFAKLIYLDGGGFGKAGDSVGSFGVMDISSTYFNGSYLFENSCFLGVEYLASGDEAQFVLSPGYRFGLGKNGYVSLGLDYAVNQDFYSEKGIVDYELKTLYYGNKFKAYGQLVIPDSDTDDSDYYLGIGGTYQVMKRLTLGARYVNEEDDYRMYEVGFSTSFAKLGVDLSYTHSNEIFGRDLEEDIYQVHGNVVYSFADNLRAGAEIVKFEGEADLVVIFKGKYTLNDKKSLTLMHQVPVDETYISSVTYFSLDYKF